MEESLCWCIRCLVLHNGKHEVILLFQQLSETSEQGKSDFKAKKEERTLSKQHFKGSTLPEFWIFISTDISPRRTQRSVPMSPALKDWLIPPACATYCSRHGTLREHAERGTNADCPVGEFGGRCHFLSHRLPHLSVLQLWQRKEAETAQRGPREPDERAFGQGDVQPLSY